MFDWLFKSDRSSFTSSGSELNRNTGISFLKLSGNQLMGLDPGSLSNVEKLGEKINLNRDLELKYEPEKFSDSSRSKNDLTWSSLHQLGFDSIMPDHFEICHDENPKPEAIDFSGKRVRKNPKYFSERDLHLLETVGKIMKGAGHFPTKGNNKAVENIKVPSVVNNSKHQVAKNEEVPSLKEKKGWDRPLTANTAADPARYSKTVKSWEKPLEERYATSADKELAEARAKIRSWEKPLEERYTASADKELAEARKKLYG